jgi:hypothetical protein
MSNSVTTRPQWEMADVLRRFSEGYMASHGLPSSHLRVINDIVSCRTAALGGHLERCDNGSCAFERPVYNSCGNRHCPKCGTMAKEKWLEARRADLLPVPYYHKVFTLPHQLNTLTLANKRIVLGLLFRAVADTLLQFGRDPRSRLGGKVGFTLVLHTWNQQLLDHFHLHCVIPAGALSDDGATWIPAKHHKFLFSVRAMSIVFRSKFISLLTEAFTAGKLIFPGNLAPLGNATNFDDLLESLRRKKWVVYSKAPFGGPGQVLDYLGRYTHRVALGNHRIRDVGEQSVTFSYRDRANDNKKKTMTLSSDEFIRRFLLHVLPSGFQRIRHYGILAGRSKADALAKCRAALGAATPADAPEVTAAERLLSVAGIDIKRCPCCKIGEMQPIEKMPPGNVWLQKARPRPYSNTS